MKFSIIIIFVLFFHYAFSQRFENSEKYYYLVEHNTHRNIIGTKDLRWSDTLEAAALKQAEQIAQKPISADIEKFYGVNIFKSTELPTAKEVIASWITEQRYYHGEAITEQNLRVFGSYTQVIWSQTVSVGCAMSQTKGGLYIIVCLYYPKGNAIGEKPVFDDE